MNRIVVTLLIAVLAWIVWAHLPPATHAAGVVGDGTPTSCTEAALEDELAGGGLVMFNCGAAETTILFTRPKTITANTTIRGGGRVIFDGQNTTRLFNVDFDVEFQLEGLILVRGRAPEGGAIFNDGGHLTIQDTEFFNNAAIGGAGSLGGWDEGNGGVIFSDFGEITIERSRFLANMSLGNYGGAIFGEGTQLTVRDSLFMRNSARADDGRGGAIAVQFHARILDVSGTEFLYNEAYRGGAIYARDYLIDLTDNTFEDNAARQNGGAMYLDTTRGIIVSSHFAQNIAEYSGGALQIHKVMNHSVGRAVTVRSSTFEQNTSRQNGGALEIEAGRVVIESTRFRQNRSRFGGAINIKPYTGVSPEVTLQEVEFDRNRATKGGGVYLSMAEVTITEALLVSNTADEGGGVYVSSGTPHHTILEVQNTTFTYNRSITGGGLYVSEGQNLVRVSYSTFYRNVARESAQSIHGFTNRFAHNILYTSSPRNDHCSTPQPNISDTLSIQWPGTTCGAHVLEIDPHLELLADNGGFTRTHDFKYADDGSVSFAIDRVTPDADGHCDPVAFDQRIVWRPVDADGDGVEACDLGALETERDFSVPCPTCLVEVTPTPVPTDTPQFVPQCGNFAVLAPRDGMLNGQQPFYWEPAPDATSYQFLIYDAEQGPLLASVDIPASASSATIDVSSNTIGGSFFLRYELHALYYGQIFCTDVVSLQREPPAPIPGLPEQPPQPACGNGICEQGENPNNCQVDCP